MIENESEERKDRVIDIVARFNYIINSTKSCLFTTYRVIFLNIECF